MDPVINSLVQSPLVRSMSTVPSKASSFVHGVRDNVPPFSYQKVVVQPWNNPSTTSQEQSHKFRIPQFGTLNRAYLRIQTVNQTPTVANTLIAESSYPVELFEPGSSDPVDNTKMDELKVLHRLPWVHQCQMTQTANKGAPFGGGGTSTAQASALVDPVTAKPLVLAANVEFSAPNRISEPDARTGKASNAWNVCNILDEIRLTTNGKLIETVYGETIPSEVVKMAPGLRDFYLKGMVGWANGDDNGIPIATPTYSTPWDPSACFRDIYGRYGSTVLLQAQTTTANLVNQHAAFICPVPLSSLKSLPKNYQTRFVEDMEIEVKMKELARGFNEFTAGEDLTKHHKVELVLIYHNWHDNIENTIRNSNYKRGVPASVYSTNWVRAAVTAKVTSATGTLTIPITSRNLVTEMVVVARAKKTGTALSGVNALAYRKSDYTLFQNREFVYDLELVGSGKSIWSATNKELMGPDSADYDLVERRASGGDCAYGGGSNLYGSGNAKNSTGAVYTHSGVAADVLMKHPGGDLTHGGVDYSFGDNMAIMRFGFQTTDEFYSGGIALQTISNPTIKITPRNISNTINGDNFLTMGVEFDVYVKHANLVRIDSDTGAVTRTLDV